MKHYVVIYDWSNEGMGNDLQILGVYDTLEEAVIRFNECLSDEKEYAEEHGYKVFEESDTCYDAGIEGYYVEEHTYLRIEVVKNKPIQINYAPEPQQDTFF